MKQRVLVTGAGGFVGRHIVTALLDAGWHVVALDNAWDETLYQTWAAHPAVTLLQMPIENLPALDVTALIHAAAITRQPDDAYSPETHLYDNLLPTLHLLLWVQEHQIQRAIFLSSDAVFATSSGVITEDQHPTPNNTYAVAKAATENMIATLRNDYGRDVLTVRLSGVYGTGEMERASRPNVSLVQRIVQTALQTGTIIVPAQSTARTWTLASDIGRALVALLNTPTLHHALYNVATEERLTALEIAQAIQRHLPHIPIAMDDTPIEPTLRQGYLSHARLKSDTGFSDWTPFEVGIGRVIESQEKQSLVPSP
jgi:nucleoside-diphosphate-sugar epimerase